jgi:hypothetical protein
MTQPPNADPVCGGCFLYETRGVCPAARDIYGLHNSAEAERRAERFRQAITEDAAHAVGLYELVRLDAERQSAAPDLAAAERLALLRPVAASADPTRKERVYVPIASATR